MFDKQTPIDVDNPTVLSKWADALRVTELEVLAAVEMVGRMPPAIAFYLKSKSGKRKVVITAADRAKYEIIKLQRRKKRLTNKGDGG